MQPSRILIALVLVAAPLLAGCLSGDGGDVLDDGAGDPAPAYTVPPVGQPDVDRMFDIYQPFVEDYSTRKGNHEDHVGARDELARLFSETGLDVVRQNFTNGIHQENILGIQWGLDRTNWVVVGAHYDTTTTGGTHDEQSQGAYDDGSGTMMLVELARAFAGIQPYHTIVYAAFDGEERGLQGSQEFFYSVIEERFHYEGVTFHAMLNLDMFGLNWPVCAPIYFDANEPALEDRVRALADEIGIPDDMILYRGITLGQSDYAHWYNYQEDHIPTGFFIADFEELAAPGTGGQSPAGCLEPVPGAYPFWHVVDTWETMTAMAGGDDNLKAGFDTALTLSAGVVHHMAYDADGGADA